MSFGVWLYFKSVHPSSFDRLYPKGHTRTNGTFLGIRYRILVKSAHLITLDTGFRRYDETMIALDSGLRRNDVIRAHEDERGIFGDTIPNSWEFGLYTPISGFVAGWIRPHVVY